MGEEEVEGGRVFEIREFCLHDGPGPRTTIFLQGCPLRCTWCQNPEGQRADDGTGRTMSVDEVVQDVLKSADFLKFAGGGVTFSGGEPLTQSDFVCAIADRLRAEGLSLSLETSGYASEADYRRVASRMDLVFQDLKHPDREAHRRWTGVDPEPIWRNLSVLKASGVPFVVRIPTLPGVNDSPAAKEGFARLLSGASNLKRIELLPYNSLAGAKYAKLGRTYDPGFDETGSADLDVSAFAAHGLPCVALS